MLLWTLVCMYLFDLEFSLGIGPGVGLLNHMITLFSFLRHFHTVFQSDYISLHSHQKCRRVLFSPHPLQHKIYHLNRFKVCISVALTAFTLLCNQDQNHPYSELFHLPKLRFYMTWMELEIIILSERSQINTVWYCLYVESKKVIQMNLTYKTEIDSQK